MCGIAGYWSKSDTDGAAGDVLLSMLTGLGRRGPDSAGIALYTSQPRPLEVAWVRVPEDLGPAEAEQLVVERASTVARIDRVTRRPSLVRLELERRGTVDDLRAAVERPAEDVEVVSLGRHLELVKQVGSPGGSSRPRSESAAARGSHGIGHTRLSTESRVDLSHSQPFWAHGVADLATVHNGHITNYHKLRRLYEQRGVRFFTENDSEVIGVYLADQLERGRTLERGAAPLARRPRRLLHLPGRHGRTQIGFAHDPFGFKPLIVAETDALVAIATEEIALRARARAERALPTSPPADVVQALAASRLGRRRTPRPPARDREASRDRDRRIDCDGRPVREINRAIRAALAAGPEREIVVRNPGARHNLGVALLQPGTADVRGQRRLLLRRHERRRRRRGPRQRRLGRWPRACCSGTVVVDGNAGNGAAASIRGGTVVVRGDCAARAGIAMKGGTLLIGGNAGYMTGFMMQKGVIVICGDAGDGARRLDVRGHRSSSAARSARSATTRCSRTPAARRPAISTRGARDLRLRRRPRRSRRSSPAASSGTSSKQRLRDVAGGAVSDATARRTQREPGLHARASSRTSRPRPSWAATASAASARSASGRCPTLRRPDVPARVR